MHFSFIPDFSHQKPFPKLLLLMIIIMICMLFSSLFAMGTAVLIWGERVLQVSDPSIIKDSPSLIAAYKYMQMINHAGTFLLSGFIYLFIADKPRLKSLTSSKLPPQSQLWMLLLLIIISTPWISKVYEWNRTFSLSYWPSIEQWLERTAQQSEDMVNVFLHRASFIGALANVLIIAVLPALGEELIFRGILQPLLNQWWKNIHLSIMISALLFSMMHLDFFGFLPRLGLGIMFGYLYYFSANLWLPILAHFLNNFLALVVSFLSEKHITEIPYHEFGSVDNLWVNLFSFIFTLFIFAWFYKIRMKTLPSKK